MGSNIVHQSLAAGHEVLTTFNSYRPTGREPYRLEPLDMRDPAGVRANVNSFRPDLVIHSAILNDLRRLYRDRSAAWEAYVESTRSAAGAAADGPGFDRLGLRRNAGGRRRVHPAQSDQLLRRPEDGRRDRGPGAGRSGGSGVRSERDPPRPPLGAEGPGSGLRILRRVDHRPPVGGPAVHGMGVGSDQHGRHPFAGRRERGSDPGHRRSFPDRGLPLLRHRRHRTHGSGPARLRGLRSRSRSSSQRPSGPRGYAGSADSLRHDHHHSTHQRSARSEPDSVRRLLERFRDECRAVS